MTSSPALGRVIVTVAVKAFPGGAVYSGVLTVGHLQTGAAEDFYGYSASSSTSSLHPVEFTAGGSSYMITNLSYEDLSGVPTAFSLQVTTTAPSGPAFTLSLDDAQFHTSATHVSGGASVYEFDNAPAWTAGQKVAVSLGLSPVPEVSITPGPAVTEGWDAVLTVTADPAPLANLDVVLNITTAGSYGVTIGPSILQVPPNQRTAELRVATASDRDEDEAPGSVTATLVDRPQYAIGTPASATVAINDSIVHDRDGDNLIDINSLAQLNSLRWDLDFDANGNGQADAGDLYWNNGAGWEPIRGWNATFDGGYRLISNLFINRTEDEVGLFGRTEGGTIIRNVGLINVDVTGGDQSGSLVGRANDGHISKVYATGSVESVSILAGIDTDDTGGLVGWLDRGELWASWADVDVAGDVSLGGLVGRADHGASVVASYSLGDVVSDRAMGPSPYVGGVLGFFAGQDTTVTAAYYDRRIRMVKYGTGDPHSSRTRTTTQLRNPAGYTGIYAGWNADLDNDGSPDDPWDFGASSQYPALKGDRNQDGVFTWQEFGDQGRLFVTIAADDNIIAEGDPAGFTLANDTPFRSDLLVNLKVTILDRQYWEIRQASANAAQGQTTARYAVTPTDDHRTEPEKYVRVEVLPGEGYTVGAPAAAVVIVRDNDAPDLAGVQPSFESGRTVTASWVSPSGSFNLHVNGAPDPSLGPLTWFWKQTDGPVSDDGQPFGRALHPGSHGCERTPTWAPYCTVRLNRITDVVPWITPTDAPPGEYTFGLWARNPQLSWRYAGSVTATVAGAAPVATAQVTTGITFGEAIISNNNPQADTSIQGSGATVRLSGLASTGRGLRYSWRQVCDAECPDPVELRQANSATPSFTAPDVARPNVIQLQFELTVTDLDGNQDRDTIYISVEDLNPETLQLWPFAIIADLGCWVKYEDGGASGPWVVECTEAELEQDTLPGNSLCHYEERAPLIEGERLTLDGTGSYDPKDDDNNGPVAGYFWEQVSGSGGTLTNVNGSRATFTAPTGLTSDEAYTIRLTVTDDDGATDTAEVTGRVTAAPNAKIDPTVPLSVDTGQSIELRAAVGGYPGEVVTYQWTVSTLTASGPMLSLSGVDGTVSRPDSLVTLTFPAPAALAENWDYADYRVKLTATDASGVSASDTVVVRVRTPRTAAQLTPPVVNAGPDQEVVKRDEVQLAGSASQANDEPLIYEWTQTAGQEVLLYYSYSLVPSFTAPEVDQETALTFRLEVCISDAFVPVGEEICASDEVKVTVLTEPRPPAPPGLAAEAGADQVVAPGSIVTLSGSATLDGGPPDETLTYTYLWRQTSGPQVNLQNATLPTTAFRAPENDGAINLVLEVQLTITETGTASRTATDTVRVEVFPASGLGRPEGRGPASAETSPTS